MELLVLVAAVTVGALLKGITGMGLPPIVLPVLAGVIGVERAVVVLSIPTAATNGWLAWRHRAHRAETRHLGWMLTCGAAGALIGAWLLTALDDRIIVVALAVLVLAYVVVALLSPGTHLPARTTRVTAPPVGLVAGTLQGATGLSGPVLATYLHALGLTPEGFVLSISTLFGLFALAQATGLLALGRFTGQLAGEGVLVATLALLLLPVGMRLRSRLSRRAFDLLVLAVLVGSVTKLLYNTFA